jgi:iron complex transport system substrate-binding protein
MLASVRPSDPIALAAALALWAGAAAAAPPERVVSMNLCTDQLAMLLAAPGQLVSVSYLSLDPLSSAMVDEARAYPINRGGAEQIYLMHPDLVLAGTYTARASVDLLESLGIRIVQLPPADTLADVAAHMRLIGTALGRAEEGEAMAAAFEADLAQLGFDGDTANAAIYYPNGYTAGSGTLSDQILQMTGFRNVGAEAGLTGGGILPLERLVMAEPEVVVTSTPYPGASRSEEILTHPALQALRDHAARASVRDADWVCGTPHILNAIRTMAETRAALEAQE